MKRFILTYLLFLLALASCDLPMSNLSSDQRQSSPNIASEIPPGAPPALADSIRNAIWQQFKEQNGSEWQIRWNKRTGLPASIFSGLTEKTYPGHAEQAGRAFLADHGALFGFKNLNNLQHVKTQTHRGIRHVTFNQTVEGIPVYEAEYKVHLRPDGRADMANGTYYPNIDISTSPSVTKSGAIQTARSDLEVPQGAELEVNSQLVIYPDEGRFHLAWKTILYSEQPLADWFYMVDAHSGAILHKFNRLTDVTGDGDVYPTHPGLSSVTNRDLYRLNGNGRLQGIYAYVVNDEASEAYSASHTFQYSTSNTHFDETNLYYHVDNFRHNFIENLGNLGFTQITAHAHATHPYYGDTNAWFSPSSKDIYFGDASSSSLYNDFAKEDKVIHHEYGHAVIYEIQSGISSGSDEEGAVSEGTPDYWTGSFTNRSVIGDYIGSTRDMANPDYSDYSQLPRDQYGNVNAESHAGGEFFSAILWDLRSEIGASIADFLVFDALYRVTSDPDFLEFRDAMMTADDAAYSGSHNDLIQDTFAARGVGDYSPLDVIISGPSSLAVGEQGTWTTSVSGGSGSYSYEWYYESDDTNGEWTGPVSTTDSYTTQMYDFDNYLNLRVDVTGNLKEGSQTYYVSCSDCGSGGGGGPLSVDN